jgi:hypothetical protein
VATDSVYAQDLIASLQKRRLLSTLRLWREESESSVEVDLLNDLIRAIEDGDFDG